MKKALFTICIIFFCLGTNYAQENARVTSLQNQLELLKVEVPGLEEALNINIAQTTLSNFLLAISKVHGLNINVAPELNAINIVNSFSNVTVNDVIVFLVKEYELDIDFTGNILSIKKFVEPQKEQKEVNVSYSATTGRLSLDLKNNKLDRVFRKIMDVSGKNLLYTQGLELTMLSSYIKDVPFDLALEKMAEANNLVLTVSRDGFYRFDNANVPLVADNNGQTSPRPTRRKASSFYYKILDSLNRTVAIDLQNTPISEVIYTIGDELNLDIFTASPLDDAGLATVTADNISFELLLDKIFESAQSPDIGSSGGNNTAPISTPKFTYKREGAIYYFGTEDQLSLKRVELITMMHRSVQLLSNPSGKGQRRAGGSSFRGTNSSFGNINNFGQNQNNGQNPRNNSNSSGTSEESNTSSIEEIIPDDVKAGLDIKVDTELNSFVVSGPGANVERFKSFISYIDKPVPMILIEVMILEVSRSAIVETGVSFGIGEQPSNTLGSVFPNTDVRVGAIDVNKIIGNFNGFGSLNIGKVLPEFYLDIKAMESNGNIKVLSTPKLSTINGHKAYLSSGITSYYAVTTQNFIGSQNPINSEITNYLPIDAELALEISPFVSGDGEVTLDVQVIQSIFNGERIADDAPPGMNSREFSSIIRMRDQDVAILGGIEEVRKDDSGSGVPLLARIPIIKYLFSKRRREDSKRKLNILIKPTVIY